MEVKSTATWVIIGNKLDLLPEDKEVILSGGWLNCRIMSGWQFLKDVGMEIPKSTQTRCRDSRITKLNIHSPIPTSFSHVNCNINNSNLITRAMNTIGMEGNSSAA